MFATFALFALFSASVVTASGPNRVCGSVLTEDIIASEMLFQQNKVDSVSNRAPYTLNLHFHVISKDATPSGGNIPDYQIRNQMSVLNDAYRPTGISWKLASTTRTVNARWFSYVMPGNSDQEAMKRQLRKGGPADLNVYTVGFEHGDPSDQLLGYGTFPLNYTIRPWADGVVILYSTLQGGSYPNINLGKNLVHEVGHWVGLYHTFEGGCSGPGDYVNDTPPEATFSTGCQSGRDTCPGGGVDPIHNYMDYSYDYCLTEFTPGQINRLRAQMATYRGLPG